MTNRIRNPSTQEDRVLSALEAAQNGAIGGEYVGNDGWVNKQYFLRILGLTQAGRAIWNLENRRGIIIEHSQFKDEHGFVYYRLAPRQLSLA